MHEKMYMHKCLTEVEQKLQWASRDTWVYEDFKQLQNLIFDASSINLSVHTLERLFGKLKTQENYNPQIETKNALAIFLGYKSWSHYKLENKIVNPEKAASVSPDGVENRATTAVLDHTEAISSGSVSAPAGTEAGSHRKMRRFYPGLLVALSCCAVLIFFFLYTKLPSPPVVSLKAVNPYGRVPHTAKFNFESHESRPKPLQVNFGEGEDWTPKETQSTFFRTYMFPGIYVVSLKQNSHILATTRVFIDTQGWQGFIYKTYEDNKTRNLLPANQLRSKNRLYTPPGLLNDSLTNANYFIEDNLVRDFGVDGDNLTFDTRFRSNVGNGGMLCNDMWFKLTGTQGVLKMHFLVAGCSGYIQMIFGDQQLDGRVQDLSTFTRDFSNWKTARMKVANKQVSIYFDDKLIYRTTYSKPIGDIMAISVTSKGSGETDYVRLYDQTMKLAFSDDFR
jgi:hypothetical protein